MNNNVFNIYFIDLIIDLIIDLTMMCDSVKLKIWLII